MLKDWNDLPNFMKTDELKPYWIYLRKKRIQIILKRVFDIFFSLLLLFVFLVPMIIIAILIKIDSSGTVFYRQERITQYGKCFKIHKFRTMIQNADRLGSSVTVQNDSRITKIGKKLRKYRLDELPQLFDIISGNMSFVGTRPEAVKYVKKYKNQYYATLLMPAGITSEASIRFKDEEKLIDGNVDIDCTYVNKILPLKMYWNLKSIKNFNVCNDIITMFRTVFAVLGKEYKYK